MPALIEVLVGILGPLLLVAVALIWFLGSALPCRRPRWRRIF